MLASEVSDVRSRVDVAVKCLSSLAESRPLHHSGKKRTRIEALLEQVSEDTSTSLRSEEKLCRPFSRDAYIRRLMTYRVSTWFGKPDRLAPTFCAAKGWANTSNNTLTCENCDSIYTCELSSVTGIIPSSSINAAVMSLSNKHGPLCPWRTAQCPWHFVLPTILLPRSHATYIKAQKLRIAAIMPRISNDCWRLSERCVDDILATLRSTVVQLIEPAVYNSITNPEQLLYPFALSLTLGDLAVTEVNSLQSMLSSPVVLPVLLQLFGWEEVVCAVDSSTKLRCRCCSAELSPQMPVAPAARPSRTTQSSDINDNPVMAAAKRAMAAATKAFHFIKGIPETEKGDAISTTALPSPDTATTAGIASPSLHLIQQHKWFCPWNRSLCPISPKILAETKGFLSRISVLAPHIPSRVSLQHDTVLTEVKDALVHLSSAAFGGATPSFLAGLYGISEDTASLLPHAEANTIAESVYPALEPASSTSGNPSGTTDASAALSTTWPGWLLSWMVLVLGSVRIRDI